MSLTFKLLSLVIRTAAKPIGNYIKRQAHEHEGFRRFAINQAQRVHRIDMRMRLGLLHDPEAQQRMHEREQKAAEDKKRKDEAPTVRTEEEQMKHDEKKDKAEPDGEKKEEKKRRVRIKPLSDSRAIELGANFFSEAFIFGVAVSLLLLENYRRNRESNNKKDEVQDRLDFLEAEVERLRNQHNLPELEALNERLKRAKEAKTSWYNPAGWWRRTEPDTSDNEGSEGVPGEVEGSYSKPIPGNVPGPPPEKRVKPASVAEQTTIPRERDSKKMAERPSAPERVDSVQATSKGR